MLWFVFLISIPVCIELAGWVADGALLAPLLNEGQGAQIDVGKMFETITSREASATRSTCVETDRDYR
jgi:hypothetical protein